MGKFKDPRSETLDALKSAVKDGFVFEALLGGRRIGVLVIIRTAFGSFQPKYHLAYIALRSDELGKGYGKRLMKKLEDLTAGNYSLHVGPGNLKALGFYEKMGLKVKYLRMMK